MGVGVVLPEAVLDGYRRFSLYNSPFPAHDRGRAVDLYPEEGRRSVVAPSPVAGVVRGTRTVRGPSRRYAADRDHLVLIDVDRGATGLRVQGSDGSGAGGRGSDRERGTGDGRPAQGRARRRGTGRGRRRGPESDRDPDPDLVARVLHVDPSVAPGDRVALGAPLGETVRSGFFAPWVADHLHLGLRPADRDLRRATGSVRLALDVRVEPLRWDGTGRVASVGETYVALDAPAHPAPGEGWVGAAGGAGIALDGGLPHYPGGGAHAVGGRPDQPRVVALAGTPVGRTDGRTVRWRDVTVTANGRPMTGVSLAVGRDADFGINLVSRDGHPFEPGDRIVVGIEPGRR